MKCEYCGSKLTKKEMKCPNCGAPAPASREDKLFDMIEDTMEENMKILEKAKEEAEEDAREMKEEEARKKKESTINSNQQASKSNTDTGYHPNTDFSASSYAENTGYKAASSGKKNTFGIIALVFSITYVLGIVGLIMGIIDLVKKKSKNRIYSIIAIAVFVFYIALAGIGGSSMMEGNEFLENALAENEMQEELDVEAIANEDEIIYVTHKQMMYDLDTDVELAESTYYGKYIELTGEFNGVKSYDDYCFEISEVGDAKDIECTFTLDQADEIDKLTKYKDATIRGVITKVSSVYGYEMTFTEVIKTAEELAEERSEPMVDENAIPETREEVIVRRFDEILDIECEDLAASWDTENNCYKVSYHPTRTYLDETHFVELNFSHYINFCREMYQLEDMEVVDFEVYMEMVDSKGNEAVENVISMRMDKEEFATYDWDNLKNKPIYHQFMASCDYAWIHEGVLNATVIDEVDYRP